jgi:hypothetical protein
MMLPLPPTARPPCRWLLALLVLSAAPAARSEEFYYLMVFGSQQAPLSVKYSHTFAVFVKATGQGPWASAYTLEAHTISWLPANLDLRPAALFPECGRNFDVYTSLRVVLATGQHVSLWGPYQIRRELYEGALGQIAYLESGQIGYKVIDTGYPADRASNCIHAVSDLAGVPWVRVFSPWFGQVAAGFVTRLLSPWIIDAGRRHDWVASRLGLDAYPLLRCDPAPPGRPIRVRLQLP